MVGAAVELVALGVGDVLVRLVVDEGGDRLGHAGVDPAPTAARMAAPVAVVSTLVGTLTGRPVTSALIWRHRWRMRDAPSARAALVASSAALLMHRVTPLPGPTSGRRPLRHPHVNPYVIPHALGVRTPGFAGRVHQCWSVPLRGASPPRGSGAARPGGALRAIDASVRPRLLADRRSAAPSAANSALPWLSPSVESQEHRANAISHPAARRWPARAPRLHQVSAARMRRQRLGSSVKPFSSPHSQ
jgi:hypothetical protein